MTMNLPQLYVERFLKIDAELWAENLTMFTGFPAGAGMLVLTWTVFHSSSPEGAAYLVDAAKAAALGKLARELEEEMGETGETAEGGGRKDRNSTQAKGRQQGTTSSEFSSNFNLAVQHIENISNKLFLHEEIP